MIRICATCRATFDDAECNTQCPHHRFLSSRLQVQKDLALTLLGKRVQWRDASRPLSPDYTVMTVTSVEYDGMVTVSERTGLFSPYGFEVVA